MGKFDAKSDEGVFLGFSTNSQACRVYNMRTQTIMESANVTFDDFKNFAEYFKESKILNFTEEAEVQESKETGSNTIAPLTNNFFPKSLATPPKTPVTILTPLEIELGTLKTPHRELDEHVTREPSARV